MQWKDCDDYTPGLHGITEEASLSSSLVHINGTHDRFSFTISRLLEIDECERWVTEITTMDIALDMLGDSSVHHPTIDRNCHTFPPPWNKSRLSLTAADDREAFHPLSTFHVTIHLAGLDAEERGCMQANVTPELSPPIKAALRFTPSCILIFVLCVGVVRSVRDSSASTEDAPQPLLPGFADCLQYLQFIFLTGGLSIFYPGFYQPAVSRLGWTSLFADGLITHGFTYHGINDGIYEINGTYGGTFGLELMTQIVGAPMTMDTWLNMVILIVFIAFVSAVCLEVYRLLKRPPNSDTGLRRTFVRTLHIILSYFMLPLIALSFYQIDCVSYLPAYHISLAFLLIGAIIMAFAWLLLQIPTRSLGVLIFDNRNRYRQLPASDTSGKKHKSFVVALFVLVFIRGVAIGGLQISGLAQLAVLGACELILLACNVQFQAYSLFSIGTVSAVARLTSLANMVAFVPGVASDNARSAIGYINLSIHMCVLILGFFAPAVIDLGKALTEWWSKPTPEVYSLNQLRRRQGLRINLPDRESTQDPSVDGSVRDDISRDAGATRQSKRTVTNHSPHSSASISSPNYYRPPRHSQIPSIDYPGQQNAVRSSSISTEPFVDDSSTERSESSLGASSSNSNRSSSPSEVNTSSTDTRCLHPRWTDYSFRESDLYYGIPRPAPTERISNDTLQPPTPRSSPRSFSPANLWGRISREPTVTERGFSVVRPNRPPNASIQSDQQPSGS